MYKKNQSPLIVPLFLIVILVILACSACSGQSAKAMTFETIQIPGPENMSIQLPEGWAHYGQAANWSPDGGNTLIGIRSAWNQPGMEPEAALLPPDSVVRSAEDVEIAGSSVRVINIEIFEHRQEPSEEAANSIGYEENYLVTTEDGSMVLDFYCRAEKESSLQDLQAVMENLISTYTWTNPTK